ncbi:PhaM family polyhydroxyalkanoate granule multifunctional regulatory protein [Pollutimonas sp. M17]|uniref:PhaM family polyhydroxyalkanoate granule multifunctional regulatory protein n=1 Tax=Pollutimonas sp. M17 TaxID=2962065 RepID=UPI0021F3E2BA|nr:PhaM family polyhydroxyalkanoate granule multifunctional regulatory protein [Pollutimonas sp. M17]UYO93605.1 transcriptional regulator [Pollutimonas sp. M17]
MTTQNHNPFVLPGFGQSGDMAGNPLMASMEMMRQAWQGLAGSAGMDQAAMAAPISLEDLDRRIADLRAVENWLRMNLSMLSSTIQGLEVQRATISTLKSFMGGMAGSPPAGGPSPLEQVLGIKPAAAGKDQTDPGAGDAYAAQAAAAAQGWWDMLQKQFDSLAAATSATLQGAEAAAEAARQSTAGASSDTTLGKAAGKARKTAGKSAAAPAKTVRKAAARPRSRASSPRKER